MRKEEKKEGGSFRVLTCPSATPRDRDGDDFNERKRNYWFLIRGFAKSKRVQLKEVRGEFITKGVEIQKNSSRLTVAGVLLHGEGSFDAGTGFNHRVLVQMVRDGEFQS